MAASNAQRIVITIAMDTRQVPGALNQVTQATTQTTQALNNTGAAMSRIQTLFARVGPGLLASLGVAGLAAGFQKIIGGASDLNETISKTKAVFGSSAQAVLDWSKDSAKAMGMSRQAALDGASAFGNFFAQVGLAPSVTAKMSQAFVELARDFASFQNAKPEDVMMALQAATRGEYDALQRYVPTVNAAAIQTQAMAESGKKNAKALTDAEKATALYHIVVRDAGAATGDFERTSTGAANQQRILRAQLEETAVALGTVLIPAYSAILTALNAVGPAAFAATAAVVLLTNRVQAVIAGQHWAALRVAFTQYQMAVSNGIPRITAGLTVLQHSLTGVRTAMSGLVAAMGGWTGVILAVVTFSIFAWINANSKAKAAAKETTDQFLAYAEALSGGVTPETVKAGAATLAHGDKMKAFLAIAKDVRASTDDIVSGLNGDVEARKRVVQLLIAQADLEYNTAQATALEKGEWDKSTKAQLDHSFVLREQAKAYEAAAKAGEKNAKQLAEMTADAKSATQMSANMNHQIQGLAETLNSSAVSVDDFTKILKAVGSSAEEDETKLLEYSYIVSKLAGAELDATGKTELFKSMLDGIDNTVLPTASKFDTLALVFDKVARAEINAKDKTTLLKDALDQLYGRFIDQSEAAEKVVQTQVELAERMAESRAGFDLTTAKTNDNRTAVLANRDALEAALLAIRERYVADVAAGESADVARQKYEAQRLIIISSVEPNRNLSASVQDLVNKYGEVPQAKNTDITVTGGADAMRQLLKAFSLQKALAENMSTNDWIAYYQSLVSKWAPYPQTVDTGGRMKYGGGGLVPGQSPHDRADNIATWLTAREYVHPVSAVNYYGVSAMDAIRDRSVPRELLNPTVLRALNRTLRRPRVDHPGDGSQGIQYMAAGGLSGGPNWPFHFSIRPKMPVNVAAMERQMRERGDILSWLYAQNGKPYGWANAGPSSYDCSGIVSAVWNLLAGRSPYNHTFSTAGEASFFSPGAGPRLTAGWANPGERGGGSVGHTAGRLWGVGFESTGSRGVRVGSGTTPPESFAHIGHFDGGGPLRPGWTAVYNGTGGYEYVTPDAPIQIVINMDVKGNVTAEKDLAATIAGTIRNELIKHGRRNGGKTGLSG